MQFLDEMFDGDSRSPRNEVVVIDEDSPSLNLPAIFEQYCQQ